MSQAEDLRGRRIGVLGLGRSGVAAARLALAHGAAVYASDAGRGEAAEEAAATLRVLGADANAGGHDVAKLATCDEIILSPGIPRTVPVLAEPALAHVPVIAEVEFAARFLTAPIIAITGTNGKTTTTALAAHLLRTAGVDAPAGGNIGTALSEVALSDAQPDLVVVEVSSFQLADVDRFAPSIGILTNLAPDHLDRYESVEAYYADKARLFRNATPESRWILNGEDEAARALPADAPGERFYFRVASPLNEPERGAYLAGDGHLTLRLGEDGDEPLVRADELQILGPHNVANALAAALAARLAGAELEPIRAGLRSFTAPAHRFEPVAERGGVLWINDSKATNVASTRVALRGVGRPIVLLLGGRHKGEPYTALVPEMRGRVRRVIAFGEAAPQITRDLGGAVPTEQVSDGFDAAVARAGRVAQPGDAVLLSPACSSYDQFTNYEERGRRFAELARAMPR